MFLSRKTNKIQYSDLGFNVYLISPHFPDCFCYTYTQEFCSLQVIILSKFDNRVLKVKIYFLINASKFKILFITSMLLDM